MRPMGLTGVTATIAWSGVGIVGRQRLREMDNSLPCPAGTSTRDAAGLPQAEWDTRPMWRVRFISASRRPPRAQGEAGGAPRRPPSRRRRVGPGGLPWKLMPSGARSHSQPRPCLLVCRRCAQNEPSPAPADRHPRQTVMTAGCGVAGGHGAGRGPSAGGVALLLTLTARTPVGTVPAATIVMRLSSWGSPPIDQKAHMTRPSIPWRKSRCPSRPLCATRAPSGRASAWGHGRQLTTARVCTCTWTWSLPCRALVTVLGQVSVDWTRAR